jgi:predicted HicB family RNase H-like nuclease
MGKSKGTRQRFHLRLPVELHARVSRLCDVELISINAWIQRAIEDYLESGGPSIKSFKPKVKDEKR